MIKITASLMIFISLLFVSSFEDAMKTPAAILFGSAIVAMAIDLKDNRKGK